ncbi:MAG: response regulator transcription factor [Acidimicrobiales bacterium]
MRVVLVEDDRAYRNALADALEAECDVAVVAQATTAEEAVPLVRSVDPDVVLMDVRLPGIDGIAAISLLGDASPDLPGPHTP